MRNSTLYYGVIAVGVIALLVGIYLFVSATAAAPHHTSAPAAVAIGVILLIAGIVGLFVMRPRSTR